MTAAFPTTQPTTSAPVVSVVIPTYNRHASLERVLRALARQTVAAGTFEVLVVADGCTDGTGGLCRALASEMPYVLRLIEQENAGPAAARNRAVREAHARLIVFVDDDVVPDPGLVATHLAAHAPDRDDTVVAIGPLLPPVDMRLNAWGAWEERTLCVQYAGMEAGRWQPTYRQFYTGNASIARQLILDAGGFDPRFRRAEDIELGLRLERAGCTFVFLPGARGWHYVCRGFASWARMPLAYGQATVLMAKTHRVTEVSNAAKEFHRRNRLTRWIARCCLGSHTRVGLATSLLGTLAAAAWALRLARVADAACGVTYNLRYYHGIASALERPGDFWRLVDAARPYVGDLRSNPALLALAASILGQDASQMQGQLEVGAGV